MQLNVTLSPKEQQQIVRIINRPYNSAMNFWRFLALITALAAPVYTLAIYYGDVATDTLVRAIVSYPILYLGLALFLLLSRPVLKLLGYKDTLRVGGRVLNDEAQAYTFEGTGFTRAQNGQIQSGYTFSAVTQIYRQKGFILLLHQNNLLAALPERCFASREEAAALEANLRSSVAYARGGFVQPLPVNFADCMWRFQYMADAGLALAGNTLLRGIKPGKKYVKRAGWVLFILLMVLLLVGATAWFIYRGSSQVQTAWYLFYPMWLFAFLALSTRNPAKLVPAQGLPSYAIGATTMEVHQAGLRVWGPQYEEGYTFPELTSVQNGNGFALVLRRATVAAALPYNVAPPEVVQAAVEHITRNVDATLVTPPPPAAPPAAPGSSSSTGFDLPDQPEHPAEPTL